MNIPTDALRTIATKFRDHGHLASRRRYQALHGLADEIVATAAAIDAEDARLRTNLEWAERFSDGFEAAAGEHKAVVDEVRYAVFAMTDPEERIAQIQAIIRKHDEAINRAKYGTATTETTPA